MYGGGLMLSGSLEYFGFLNLWVAPPDTDEIAEQAIDVWKRIHPDVQMVALSQHRFQEVAAKLGVDLQADCGFPNFSMGGFGRGLLPLMTAGFECYAYIGGPDRECDGAHIHEDWAIVQAIDPDTGRDVPDGQWGNMVVTTLDRDNGLLRYDLEEAAMIEPSTCPLGETSRIGFWGGRFKDLLSSQGVHFQLQDLEKAIGSVAELRAPTLEYVVVDPKGSDDPLRIRVEVGADEGDATDGRRAELADRVAAAVKETLGLAAVVDVLDRETLERSAYKLKRVVDA
jgi:phenylacetate-CoA ligase